MSPDDLTLPEDTDDTETCDRCEEVVERVHPVGSEWVCSACIRKYNLA
jgi:formylmethanofuran dehydrogenase subunit E